MFCFFPIMWLLNKVLQSYECSDTGHGPINGDEQGPFQKMKVTSLHTTNKVGVCVEKVAEYEAHCSHIEDGCWKERMVETNDASIKQDINAEEQPHEWIHKEYKRLAANKHLQRKKLE